MQSTTQSLLLLAMANALLISCSGSGEATDTQQTEVQTATAVTNDNDATDLTDPNSDTQSENAVDLSDRRPDRVTTRSPQGIQGDGDQRRQDARNRRNRSDNQIPVSNAREIRSYDGSGNNLTNREWGATFSHLQRIAPAAYADGVSTMAGESRANPRAISNALAAQGPDESILNTFGTSDFLWQWGQFLDHDINLTDGSDFESADIVVPVGDLWFDPSASAEVVIPFSRALFDPQTGTDFSNPREQENEISSWIDGSMIYGSDSQRLDELRAGVDSPFLKSATAAITTKLFSPF